MNAVEYINQHLDPRKILEYYGFKEISETEDGIRACCKIHDGDNPTAFYWNKSNNLWCCFTGDCGGGDVYTLVQKLENTNFQKSIKIISFVLQLNISGLEIPDKNIVYDVIKKDQEKWLSSHRPQQHNKQYSLSYTKYTKQNDNFTRFDPEILDFYDSAFCKVYPLEESVVYNKLVIPIYENSICIGVALRDTTGNFQPKWYYAPEHVKIGNVLYNLENAINTIDKFNLNSIILVEGIFDVWAYHRIGVDNCVAIFGSKIKDEQKKKLLKLGVDFELSFDNDKAGNKCTSEAINSLSKYSDIKIIELPDGKDPADLTPEELKACYLNSKRSGLY